MFKDATLLPALSCNASCDFCGLDRKTRRGEMGREPLKRVLKYLKKYGTEHVCVSGGEPLQDRYVPILTDGLRASGIGERAEVTIKTNGKCASSRRKAERIAKRLKAAGVSLVEISLDTFHARHIPVDYVANLARACEKNGIPYNIGARSFRSTYRDDIDLVEQFAGKVGRRVNLVIRKDPWIRGADTVAYWLSLDSCKIIKSCESVRYGMGKPKDLPGSSMDDIYNNNRVIVHERAQALVGDSRETISEEDDILGRPKRTTFRRAFRKVQGRRGCKGIVPTFMPDGRIIPCCSWEMLNSCREASLGRYPETDLEALEQELDSYPFSGLPNRDWEGVFRFTQDHAPGLLDEPLIRVYRPFLNRLYHMCGFCAEAHKVYARNRRN